MRCYENKASGIFVHVLNVLGKHINNNNMNKTNFKLIGCFERAEFCYMRLIPSCH